MSYYGWFSYMDWYNWYHGIEPGKPEPIEGRQDEPEFEKVETLEPVAEKKQVYPHEFPSANFTTNIAALETLQEEPKNFYRDYEKRNRSRKV